MGAIALWLMALGLLAPAVLGQTSSLPCPATCGNEGATTQFQVLSPDATPDLTNVPNPTYANCVAACSAFLFYQFYLDAATQVPSCQCFSTCRTALEDSGGVTVYRGLVGMCGTNPGALNAPQCPATCSTGLNGVYGWFRSSPSHVATYNGIAESATCAQRCASVSALYYQYASSLNNAFGFTAGDCDCFSSLPCPDFQSFAPMAFTLGRLCHCSNTCFSPPPLPPANPPPPSLAAISCTKKKNCTFGSIQASQYDCTLCNTAPWRTSGHAPKVINNAALVCSNWQPLETGGITPLCTVPGAIFPGKCATFYYKSSRGPASFHVPPNPFVTATVSILPSAVPNLILGPCVAGDAFSSEPNVYFPFSCTIFNAGITPLSNIQLSCINFVPVFIKGIRIDCTVPGTIYPGCQTSLTFQTGPAAVTLAVKSAVFGITLSTA